MKSGKVYIVCAMDTEGPIRNKKNLIFSKTETGK